MFTGIIEEMGRIREVREEGTNRRFTIEAPLSPTLKVDQSVAHNGVCLTVESVEGGSHTVTAVAETLSKTELGRWQPGGLVNLERSLVPGDRLDGHFVQGHVDATGTCTEIIEKGGSHEFTFSFPPSFAALVIEKGSICVNGISLTAFDVRQDRFRVAVIPYTFRHTNLQHLQSGDPVNLEFDMLGKYILRKLSLDK